MFQVELLIPDSPVMKKGLCEHADPTGGADRSLGTSNGGADRSLGTSKAGAADPGPSSSDKPSLSSLHSQANELMARHDLKVCA